MNKHEYTIFSRSLDDLSLDDYVAKGMRQIEDFLAKHAAFEDFLNRRDS